jgi:hypothetical protein
LRPQAPLDADHHPLTVDIVDLQRHHLRGAQPGAVGHRQGRLVLQPRGRLQKPLDLLATEHGRQLTRLVHMAHLGHQLAAPEGDIEEELQCRDRRVQASALNPALDQIELEAAQILRRGRRGRTLEKIVEAFDPAQIPALGLGRELAQPHVLDHALA